MIAGELFPRVGFIVTSLINHSQNVVKFYNGRGMAEKNLPNTAKEKRRCIEPNHPSLAVAQ